jgi:hypothetical protein
VHPLAEDDGSVIIEDDMDAMIEVLPIQMDRTTYPTRTDIPNWHHH